MEETLDWKAEKMHKSIRELQKRAVRKLRKLAPLIEEIFENMPITIHYRIKTKESIIEKCKRKNLLPEELADILGIRIIGKSKYFVEILSRVFNNFSVREIEDFWYHATDLGYRSFHVLIEVDGFVVELQIHTAVSSAFALLCHDFYKNCKNIGNFREAVFLLKKNLEEEAQQVNGNHVALVNFRVANKVNLKEDC
jgi:ppGpp synthetase/RelA/SpoT-type nucleotidyltranferase